MLRLLRTGKTQGVVIHKIDRSARNLKDWADLGELIDQGIEVHFANESLDLHSRGGRLSADIQAVVAADYIRNLREEAKKGIYGRLKQGFYPLPAPIGYVDQGAGKAKTIHPEKGSLVKRAFELYASGRFVIPALVDELNRIGLGSGTTMTVNGVSATLRNPFYIGLMLVKGQTFQGNHEALISKRLFNQVQDLLSGRFHTKTNVHEFAFRRLIECSRCGYHLVGEVQKGHTYYRCHTKDCSVTGIRQEAVQEVFQRALADLQFSLEEKAYLAKVIQDLKARWIADKEQTMNNLHGRIQQITERLAKLTDAFLEGLIERDLFEERKVALHGERQAIQGTLNNFAANRVSVPEALEKFLELAGSAYSSYQEAITDQKRRMVKIVTSNLALRDKTIDFTYRIPFNMIGNREKTTDGGPTKGVARIWKPILTQLLAHFEKEPELEIALVTD
jgi:site-specific DNA recombinase